MGMKKNNCILIALIVLIISSAGYIWFGIDAIQTIKFVKPIVGTRGSEAFISSNQGIIAVCIIGLITNTIFGLTSFFIASEHFELHKRLKKLEENQKA